MPVIKANFKLKNNTYFAIINEHNKKKRLKQ